jgi:transcriptional regulator of acetoin/glycerol metabolism
MQDRPAVPWPTDVNSQRLPTAEDLGRSLEDIELQTIRRVLDAAGGNISVAAKRLGISRNTIYRKLRWNQKPE